MFAPPAYMSASQLKPIPEKPGQYLGQYLGEVGYQLHELMQREDFGKVVSLYLEVFKAGKLYQGQGITQEELDGLVDRCEVCKRYYMSEIFDEHTAHCRRKRAKFFAGTELRQGFMDEQPPLLIRAPLTHLLDDDEHFRPTPRMTLEALRLGRPPPEPTTHPRDRYPDLILSDDEVNILLEEDVRCLEEALSYWKRRAILIFQVLAAAGIKPNTEMGEILEGT
ncbi:hypothetical protein R3P38DRAFT_2803685 [Favolaschia claudopus]|uniref:Uncharacterized protein n=1 Tax=Favolaschia claudopus TaxID=2862362 RepID=A0AAV9ZSD9_9AGAR